MPENSLISKRCFCAQKNNLRIFQKSGQETGWFSLISEDIFCTSTVDLKIKQKTFLKGGCRCADFSLISVRINFFGIFFWKTPQQMPQISLISEGIFYASTTDLKNRTKNFSQKWVQI